MPLQRVAALAALGLVLGGCAAPPAERAEPTAEPGRRAYQQVLEGGYRVDYEVETQVSKIDGLSCFATVTGTLANPTGATLSQRSALQFFFYAEGRLLFRDLTYPRSNVPPGARVQFELFQSPLHLKRCPNYDKIEVVLKPVLLPRAAP